VQALATQAATLLSLLSINQVTLGEECSLLYRNTLTDAPHAKFLVGIMSHLSLSLGTSLVLRAFAADGTWISQALTLPVKPLTIVSLFYLSTKFLDFAF
jgi:hypothetical protein